MILDQSEIDRLIAEAEQQLELDAVIGTAGLAAEIINRPYIPRVLLPWSTLHGKFDLRLGEVTIWAGDNGSGKSLLVGEVITWLLPRGHKALIASMEMKPAETVERMIRQAAGCDPSRTFIEDFCLWAEGKLWIYDQLDTVESDRVLRMIRAVAQKLDVQHVVIDSLVKCGVKQDGEGALTAQTHFVDKLQHLAKHLDIHIHLIAHTRKPDRDSHRVTKHDIRGASQITDLADNVVLVQRNRLKERVAQIPPNERDEEDEEVLQQADSLLVVAKQRHYSFEGTVGLDYRRDSMQFTRHGKGRAMPWPDASVRNPWLDAEETAG